MVRLILSSGSHQNVVTVALCFPPGPLSRSRGGGGLNALRTKRLIKPVVLTTGDGLIIYLPPEAVPARLFILDT